MQDVAQKNGLRVCVFGLEEYGALSNGKCGQLMAESLDGEGFDHFITVECRAVIEDVLVCARVIITVVIVRNDGFEDGEGSNDEFIVEVRVPQV